MKIQDNLPDEVVLQEIGRRIAIARLDQSLTQAELATKAGIAKRTVERLESGEVGTQFSGFLGVCRALGILDRLEVLLPEPQVSPIDLLKLNGKKRQRAARSTGSKAKKWTWGEPT